MSRYEWLRKKLKEIDIIVEDIYSQLATSEILNQENALGIGSRLIIKSILDDFKEFSTHHLQHEDQEINKKNFINYTIDIDKMIEKLKETLLNELEEHIPKALNSYMEENKEEIAK